MEFQGQSYRAFWPAVSLSDRASEMAANLTILYSAFPRAFAKTLTAVQEENRTGRSTPTKIRVAEIVPQDDVPSGIRLSYTVTPDGLLVCDLWTPPQPALFGHEGR